MQLVKYYFRVSLQDDIPDHLWDEGMLVCWRLRNLRDMALRGDEMSEEQRSDMFELGEHFCEMERTWPTHKLREVEDLSRNLSRKVSIERMMHRTS